MISLERYQRIKSKLDRLQRDKDRAEGALAQLMERLEGEHGCKTLKQAERLRAKLNREVEAVEAEHNEKMEEFESEWEGVLDDV